MRFVVGQNETVANWVADRLPTAVNVRFKNCTAVGVADKNGVLICGVVFHDWFPQYKTLCFSIAADSPKWATRNTIRQLFAYPFNELKVEKLWTITPSNNLRALKLCTGVGMTTEARLWKHFGDHDAIINRMMRKDFNRLYGVKSDDRTRQDSRPRSAA